jgi:hypothetical protein
MSHAQKCPSILFISFLIFTGCSSSPQAIVDQSGLSVADKA